jgi:sigma-B regulation protein RsbU (phosphoserine phosphatase)
MKRCKSSTAVLCQHRRDLEVARQVQQHLFPGNMVLLPGWECAARCRPARVVAGDYHDLFDGIPGRLAVALGDVAGKGLGTSLVVAGLHALVHCRLPQTANDLARLMDELNAYLLSATPDDMFVTLFLGVLELQTGRLLYVNAGHPAPLVLAAAQGEAVRLQGGGPVLGVMRGVRYQQEQVTLEPGNLLALFSDGVTEARNRRGELFAEARAVEALRAGRGLALPAVVAHLFQAIDTFADNGEPADDISLILIRGKPM